MKKTLLMCAMLLGLQCAVATPSLAVEQPGFQHKVCENGEPLAQKPGALLDFIELRHARGFSKAVLKDLKGQTHALNGYKGKLVLVDVWATWCEPCIRSLPAIKKLQERYNNDPKSDIRIVSVSVDRSVDDVKKFIKQHSLEGFTTLIDSQQLLGNDMPLDVIPSFFALDGQGNLIGFVRGYVNWGDDEVHGYLAALAKKYAKRDGDIVN